ncbi:GIY-YIG nuclease family protein [Serratia marcescens]|nr:GIY-YIG nuclease family protein [Serratia marcescens]
MTTPVWHLYMLRLPSGMLYTGITTNVARRMAEHQAGKGAKALRGKGELTLAFHCPAGDRSTALRLEYRVKQLSKIQKERLVSHPPLSLAYLLPG